MELGVEASLLGVGVDRVDYTKGILERFRGIERLLELHPAYHRRFSFIEIAAPSRTDVPRYQQFLDEVVAEAERVNARFQNDRWKPIVLLKKHHSHEEIERYYKAANVCMVTSLHDRFSHYFDPKAYRQFNTWMGDPTRALLFRAIVDEIKRLDLVAHTAATGDYLFGRLEQLQAQFPAEIVSLRGKGQGTFIAWDSPRRDEILKKAKGVGINIGGSGVAAIRLRPMLIFQKHHGKWTFL